MLWDISKDQNFFEVNLSVYQYNFTINRNFKNNLVKKKLFYTTIKYFKTINQFDCSSMIILIFKNEGF